MRVGNKVIRGRRWRTQERWQDKIRAEEYGKRKYLDHSKKSRIKKKQERIKNKRLCKKYPWLIPRNRFSDKICWVAHPYDYTELDSMPNGWCKAFGDLWCEDIQQILEKNNYVDKLRIMQIKEKFGQLRTYFGPIPKEMDDLIWAYELISEYVCVRCGRLDSPIINNYGWYEPICRTCYNKQTWREEPYGERLKEAGIESLEDMKIPTSFVIRSCSKDETAELTIDISDLVAKIRYKNRKRRSNIE